MDASTLLSPWYWVFTAAFWAASTYFSHGVPFDLMRRASKLGGEDAELCDRLARRMLAQIEERMAAGGHAAAALAGFALAALATAAFAGGAEWALGLLLLLGPFAVTAAFSLIEARRIHASLDRIEPERLLTLLWHRRWANQFAAAMAVAVAVSVMTVLHRDRLAFMGGF
ncbi:MAG: hypothetical protein AAF192_07295 [Pseudomonadota bacterium]